MQSVRSIKRIYMKYNYKKEVLEPLLINEVAKHDIETVRKGAESGLSEFQRLYAEAHLHGIGVSKDPVEAYKYLCKATEVRIKDKESFWPGRGNDKRAIALKGVLEYYGIGVAQDKISAISNLNRAAHYGDILATLNLAIIQYNEGKRRIAVKELDQLAQRFVINVNSEPFEVELYVFTHRMLAQCYIKGKGVKKNCHLAFIHWLLAAETGDVDAILNVAICYERGIGVNQDYKMAIRYFSIAVKKGNPEAAHKMGDYYSNGTYVKRSRTKALEYYQYALWQSLKAC